MMKSTATDNSIPSPKKIKVKRNLAALASDDAELIAKYFAQYLKPQLAQSTELKELVYRLRHNVYCEELGFEHTNSEQRECDEFDARSIHCFIRHVSSNHMAGTVRLVSAHQPNELLPMEQFCAHAITHETLRPSNFLRHQTCEVSRLAVPAMFRKRISDQFSGGATGAINTLTFSSHELRYFPYIAISLYMSAIAVCHKARCYHIFVMMEPRLARSLAFVGIHFNQIGPVVNYHGKRAAYYVDIREIRKNLSSGYKYFLRTIEIELFSEK